MKYVLVDAIMTYRMRYAVAVPDDLPNDKAREWAMDSVTCEEVKEFSQLPLGEQISSTRIMDEEEYIRQYDEDNDYLKGWDAASKLSQALILDDEGEIVANKADWNSL